MPVAFRISRDANANEMFSAERLKRSQMAKVNGPIMDGGVVVFMPNYRFSSAVRPLRLRPKFGLYRTQNIEDLRQTNYNIYPEEGDRVRDTRTKIVCYL